MPQRQANFEPADTAPALNDANFESLPEETTDTTDPTIPGIVAVETDGTTIAGDGTEDDPVRSLGVKTDSSLQGTGLPGNPLRTTQTGGGLATVASDATLSGDGSVSDPLSVVDQGYIAGIVAEDDTSPVAGGPFSTVDFGTGFLVFPGVGGEIRIEVDPAGLTPEMSFESHIEPDSVDATITYIGDAATGSVDSAAVWRIQRISETVTDGVHIEWADGNANFDNIWDNRESLSYS